MNEVVKVIERYVDGTMNGDAEVLHKVFYSKAIMTGSLGDMKLSVVSPKIFIEDVKGEVVSDDYKHEIEKVDIMGDVATVVLKEYGLKGADFVNYFHLQKVEDEWLIISKLFTSL